MADPVKVDILLPGVDRPGARSGGGGGIAQAVLLASALAVGRKVLPRRAM